MFFCRLCHISETPSVYKILAGVTAGCHKRQASKSSHPFHKQAAQPRTTSLSGAVYPAFLSAANAREENDS